RRTLNFYVRVLGLRLVKRTVVFNAPAIAHFYCGDAAGSPGSLIALRIHAGASPGRPGCRQGSAPTLNVPPGRRPPLSARAAPPAIAAHGHAWMFGEEHLCFADPDGLELAIMEDPAGGKPLRWARASVPAECAIQRVRAIELALDALDPTATFLVEALGF